MSLPRPLALLAALLLAAPAFALEPGSVRGRFVDPTTNAPVPGVKVKLQAPGDTADVHRATGREDGSFEVLGLALRGYRLEATRLGYAPLQIDVRVLKAGQDLGALQIVPQAVNVRGITVTESPAPAVVHGDTTEFRASAVKTHPDATAEDLVQKMPGVTVENGQVKAHGETVQQVLVNGRPFFGSDPTAAMRNLPADVVDRIQVYDRMSDQSEFSGFDDGQSQRTMNFILRDQKARFGKVYGGYGDRDRYQGGGNLSVVRGPNRFTAIGMSNNVGQQNFSPQDLIGALSGNSGGTGGPRIMMFGGPRPGGGGGAPIIRMGGGGLGGGFDPGNFFVGQQGGLTTTHSGGINLSTQASSRLTFTASVFANRTDATDTQSLARLYTPPQDSTAGYDQHSDSDTRNDNLRVDGRLEWNPDSLNSVVFAPRLYFQSNQATGTSDAGYTNLLGAPLASSTGRSASDSHGDNLTNRLTLRHRFARPGRNVTADLSYGHSLRDAARAPYSRTDWYGATTTSDTLDQRTDANSVTNSFSARVAWTEPLGSHWRGQLIWNPSVNRSRSDAQALGYDAASAAYDDIDTAATNHFTSRTTVQAGGVAALYSKGPWRWLGSVNLQGQRLQQERTWPGTHVVDQSFDDVLPSMTLTGNFSNRRTLRLAWSTSASAPSISQLQDVVDRSNPLALTTGNPGLRESYTHNLSLRWSEADPMHSRSRFVFLNVSRTGDPVGNATFTAPADTTVDGVTLARGTQLTRPVNLDESWNGNLFGVVSRPVKWLKSIASLNAGGTYSRTPARLQAGVNRSTTWALRSGATFSSNVSQNLDFTLSYQGSWNVTRNTLAAGTTGDYYAHNLGLRFNGIARHGIVVREEVTHALQSGVTDGYGRNVVLWNTTLGKKFLKDNRGELRVTLTDALHQERSVNRTVTETYVQDVRDTALGRYAQAVFTYTFR